MTLAEDDRGDLHHLRPEQAAAFARGQAVYVDCGDDGVRRIVALLPATSPLHGCHEGPVADVDDTWPETFQPRGDR